MNNTLKTWLIIFLLPLIPVIALYIIFGSQNYFNLTDTSKGLVVIGPIGAYIFLVWIVGINIYSKLSKIVPPDPASEHPVLKEIIGNWNFESKSNINPGDIRKGMCSIINTPKLKITGNFLENGKNVGRWISSMYNLGESQLDFVYELHELKEGQEVISTGICSVILPPAPISNMAGIWNLVGKLRNTGEITFSKIPKAT